MQLRTRRTCGRRDQVEAVAQNPMDNHHRNEDHRERTETVEGDDQGRVFGYAEVGRHPQLQNVSPATRTRNRNRIRARPAASAATKRADKTTTPTTVIHQFSTATERAGSASQPSQLTAYGLGTATPPSTHSDTGATGDASRASGGAGRPSQQHRRATLCHAFDHAVRIAANEKRHGKYPPFHQRLSMLSTGNHGELIIDGWLASSDENASPVRVWFRNE